MSYNIELCNKDGKPVEVETFIEGGTLRVGGSFVAELNITYNYSWFYTHFLDEEEGIGWLYGKKAKDTLNRLEKAVEELGTDQFTDYWAPTPGNAGYALNILLTWAKANPNAIWQGD